jgi:isocitrate/isopropylmalate dehydrogenase
MMLDFLGEISAAKRIDGAMEALLTSGKVRSADARSGIATDAMGNMVVDLIRQAT